MSFVHNLAYEASAGSGKTFMLVVRYLSLLFMGSSPSKIVALTFTNKAASEMRERVILTLEDLKNRDELVEISKISQLTPDEILSKRGEVLESFLSSNPKIITIDSFLVQILRKFSLYAGLMPDFSLFNAQHEIRLKNQFLAIVDASDKEELFLELWKKSNFENIFSLFDELYDKNYELERFSFASKENIDFKQLALGELAKLKELVHSSANASSVALRSVDIDSFEELCKSSWLSRETLNYSTFAKCFVPEMDLVLEQIKEHMRDAFRSNESHFFSLMFECLKMFKEAKKSLYTEDGELSFSDVTNLAYEILQLLDDSRFLYFRLDSQIEHILLDEFQDTSIIQYSILQPLIHEILSGYGVVEDGSFFFVGDKKQSIYRFRGGVSELFDEAALQNHTSVDKLLTNYRSCENIVKFVNDTFSGKMIGYSPQLAKKGGGFVQVISNDEVVQSAIEQVEFLLSNNTPLGEIAILCLTNKDGDAIQEALAAHGIEATTETTRKLVNQPKIKAILEYLKYLYFDEPLYLKNFFALVDQEPRKINKINILKLDTAIKSIVQEFGIGDQNVIRFMDIASGFSDIEALLFEFERIDTNATNNTNSGIKILTIHKSKGLEFESVIVLDRIGKASNRAKKIIYDYNNITLENIYLRTKNREFVDSHYRLALEKENRAILKEELNSIYVALTRAKTNLFVIQKNKNSLFESLELTDKNYGVFVPTQPKTADLQTSNLAFTYKELYYGSQTDLLKNQKELEVDRASIDFGLSLHYALEMLNEFEPKEIENSMAMVANKYAHLLNDDGLQEIKKRMTNLLEHKEFQQLIDGERFKEQPLKYNGNLFYIDLLIRHKDETWSVIDYKSSLLYLDEHSSQVLRYTKAIAKLTNQKCSGHLCYLLADGINIIKVI